VGWKAVLEFDIKLAKRARTSARENYVIVTVLK
jgi:hypothetical protein